MYQALYRKYRPRRFEDVVGQDHITGILRRQIQTGQTSHAYLFVGSRGTGKTTCAKILSRALNCEHPVNGDPCGECAACRGIESGGVMDVVEIDAASNNGVENIRALRDEAVFTPVSVKKRVYIVDEVHMLSTSAFNALLKILEEPPEHLVFILATTELNKIPATILSRCQRFSFKRMTPENISGYLSYVAAEENIELTAGAASLLARLADGAMRDGLSLLDQCRGTDVVDEQRVLESVGLTGSSDTANLWRSVSAGDVPGAMDAFEKMYMGGADPAAMLSEILNLCRDMMMVKAAPKGASALLSGAFGAKELAELAGGTDMRRLLSVSETIQSAVTSMNNVKDKRTAAELCLIKISDILTGAAEVSAPVFAESAPARPAQQRPVQPAPKPVPQPAQPKPAPQPAPWEDAPKSPEPFGGFEEEPAEEFVPWANAPADDDDDEPAPVRVQKTPEKPAGTDANWWEKVLDSVKASDFPTYALISDRTNISAKEAGATVTVLSKNAFNINFLDTPQIKGAVAKAAETVLGRPVTVRVMQDTEPVELRQDKLDELSRFGNIKFE